MDPNQRLPILVVEDEASIQRGLCDALAYHGFDPRGVESGEEGLRMATSGEYALVLLDVMLPGISGFDVCRELRSALPDQPILMLTARGAEEDVLEGFRCGSDDYVQKPFSVAELMARIESLLRRAGRLESPEPEVFTFGEWCVDPGALKATGKEEAIDLSRREVEMLALFSRERGRIVSRRTLLREVWRMRGVDEIETRTVDMHIAKLRKKIGGGNGSPIETIRGEGYRYVG